MAKSHWRMGGVVVWVGLLAVAVPVAAQRLDVGPSPGRIGDALQPRVIDLEPGTDPERLPVITAIGLDPAGKLLVTAGDDHLVRIWDVVQGDVLMRIRGHAGWVRAAAFSPVGGLLATAGDDRQIMLWKTRPQERADAGALPDTTPFRTIDLGKTAVFALAFSPDGAFLAASGFDQRVWIFDGRTGERLRVLEGPGQDIRALAFSPDGRQLAAAARNGRIRTWQDAAGAQVRDLEGHRRRVHALVYSLDGSLLASGGEDRAVRLWSVADGRPAGALPEVPAPIRSLAFCGSQRLAAGSSDNVIRVFSLATRAKERDLAGHTGSVATLAWDAANQMLISGGFDTTVRFWRLAPGAADRWSQRPAAPAQE